MAKEPLRAGSGSGSAGEGSRESLPRLTEVVPDYEELSPFYQRPSSAPAAGVDPTRQSLSSTSIKDPELQQSDFPSSTNVPTELPLPPLLRGANIRTYPGAGSRQPYQNPFDAAIESRSTGLNLAIERSQSDRPPPLRRPTVAEVPARSPPLSDPTGRTLETRQPPTRHPSVYDPIHEQPRRGSRGQLPPIDVGTTAETLRETPQAPQYPPLPPLRASHSLPSPAYPLPSPRYNPYPSDRPPYEQPPRRRFSQTLPRDFPRPPSPYQLRSPTATTRPPPLYSSDPYPPYPGSSYPRGSGRRTSFGASYPEERRPSRQESMRYQQPIPYGSSYPPQPHYEYSGGRGYIDPHYGYLDYHPDRRLSQQEPGEQVTHLGVPERGYRPSLGGPSSPSSIRVQPPPHAPGIAGAGTPGKRRGNLPKESKDKLKQWLSMHVEHPYPTEEEKKELAAEAGMTMGQINNWFINARRRTLPRIPGRTVSPSASRNLRRRPGES